MTMFWKFASAGIALLALAAAPKAAQAQLLLNGASGSGYTFGDLALSFSGCTIDSFTCNGSTKAEVIGVSSGRGGTTIEIQSTINGTTNILSGNNQSLLFNLAIKPITGSRGLSSVNVTVNGSATPTSDNSLVSASVSASPNPLSPTTIKGVLGTPASSNFTYVPVNSTETLSLSLNTGGVGTLSLLNVKLLFFPAPEPTSIALFATGIAGLGMARRWFKLNRRSAPKTA